jgi:hypothetical protein
MMRLASSASLLINGVRHFRFISYGMHLFESNCCSLGLKESHRMNDRCGRNELRLQYTIPLRLHRCNSPSSASLKVASVGRRSRHHPRALISV